MSKEGRRGNGPSNNVFGGALPLKNNQSCDAVCTDIL